MTSDVIVNKTDERDYYDFDWTESGDIPFAEFLDTFILMCLFEEQRADASEVPLVELRRGWIGNIHTPGFEQGSKIWQFEQERITISMLAELGVVVREALQPLIDEGAAAGINVETPFLRNGEVCVEIEINRGRTTERRFYTLWGNSGRFT